MDKLSVGILVFDGVEVLDFAGPFEVFSRARLEPGTASRRDDQSAPFTVFTVATGSLDVTATGGLQVRAAYTTSSAPPIDILVVSGGWGTRPLLLDSATVEWIRQTASGARLTTSVCSGALLLAKAGLLRGRSATTHWGALDSLRELDPSITVRDDQRFVWDGLVTSAGVSAGIDMALSVVEHLCGAAVADDTARYMDYDRRGASATA